MSYLNTLRLHFAGQFQANISTVNNDTAHFSNAGFQSSFQQLQSASAANGWFNPEGDATFRLLGCKVTAAWTPAGAVPPTDPVSSCVVADSDSRAPGKLVDLDSEQQMVSEIWGLQVRIADAQGNTLLRGDFVPAAFFDIWNRAPQAPSGSDAPACATWQSVLRNLQWGDVSQSVFLTALKKAAGADGLLSIKFNLDGIDMNYRSPSFMCGRIVGTIGPATSAEPRHLTIGRQFMAINVPGNLSFFNPVNQINFCVGVVDTQASCVFLDLGNALPTGAVPGGPMADLGPLVLSVATKGTSVPLGTIPDTGPGGYTGLDWYERTAGIVSLPLTAAQLALAASNPLAIMGNQNVPGMPNVAISEAPYGAWVRADQFVYRMSPHDVAEIKVYATQWGAPLGGAAVGFWLDWSQLQPGGGDLGYNNVVVSSPEDVLKMEIGPPFTPGIAAFPPLPSLYGTQSDGSGFPPIAATPPAPPLAAPTALTDQHGVATVRIHASDLDMVRYLTPAGTNQLDYGVDGQVYGVRPLFVDPNLQGATDPINPSSLISFLVWSRFETGKTVLWSDIQPTMQQYANLYPVMNRFLDLGDPASVIANQSILNLAFGLDAQNPNVMPVTRDLSPARRRAILAWLNDPDHPMGELKLSSVKSEQNPSAAASASPAAAAKRGGKAAAAARRLAR